MARGCRLVRDGRAVDAAWRRDGDVLVVSPAGSAPLAVALAEVSGIGGDGFTVRLRLPDGEIALERLGGDGPTLLEELRRDWPVLRAAVLRLAGGERPAQVFAGTLASSAARGPFRGFVVADRLIVAPADADVLALFAADWASAEFDEGEYAVRLSGWGGERTTFRGLGGGTAAFFRAVTLAREGLAQRAAEVAASHLPTLAAGPRAALAAQWLPGRLLSFEDLERIAAGFEGAFRSSWLAACPRAASGAALMEGLGPRDRHLGYHVVAGESESPLLWLLARRGGVASLELLSHGDYATYLFRDDGALPGLVEGLVRLPDFSREALYLKMEELSGERGVYAVPARDLPLLRGLRDHFTGRRIHQPASGE
jgi:hypothetical protein